MGMPLKAFCQSCYQTTSLWTDMKWFDHAIFCGFYTLICFIPVNHKDKYSFFVLFFFSSKNSSRLACNYLFYYMGALFGLPYQLSKGKRYRNYLKERPNCHFHGLSFHFLFVVLLNCLFFNGNFFYGYFYGNTFPVSCQYAHIWVKDKNYLTATATVKQVSEYSDPSSLMQ